MLKNVFMLEHFEYDRRRHRTKGRWTIIDVRGKRPKIARLSLGQTSTPMPS